MTSLRQGMVEDMQVRNFSPLTQTVYLQQVSLFARHLGKPPELLGPEEMRAYQVYLTNEKKLATSTIRIAAAALRFLYKVTLKKGWAVEEIPVPKKPQKLPVVIVPSGFGVDGQKRVGFGRPAADIPPVSGALHMPRPWVAATIRPFAVSMRTLYTARLGRLTASCIQVTPLSGVE